MCDRIRPEDDRSKDFKYKLQECNNYNILLNECMDKNNRQWRYIFIIDMVFMVRRVDHEMNSL